DGAHGLGARPQLELLHLPRRRLRQPLLHHHHRPRRHVPRQPRPAVRHQLLLHHPRLRRRRRAGPQLHERARRLAPVVVRPPHHRRLLHRRVAEQRRLHLDCADVLPARDYDVLGPVEHLHVPVLVPHRQVAGPEPPTGERLRRRRAVLVVAAHHRVPPQHHLPHRLPVARHAPHRGGVLDVHLQAVVVHPLPRLDPRPLLRRQRVPLRPPRAHRRRAVRLRQPVRVDHQEPLLLHPVQHLRRRRRAAGHHRHPPRHRPLLLRRGVHDHAQHRGRAAHVGDAVARHGVEDGGRGDPADAHVGAALRRDAPRHAPPVAVEHGHRPQVHRRGRHVVEEHGGEAVQVRAAVAVDHALGPRRRARRVVERDRLVLVGGPPHRELRRRPGIADEVLVLVVDTTGRELGIGWVVEELADEDEDGRRGARLGDAADGVVGDVEQRAVDEDELGLRVAEQDGGHGGVEAGVERADDGAGHRDAEVELAHRRNILREYRNL
ncbi:Os02g0119250, partial [Oryza sativa Japonica Group]